VSGVEYVLLRDQDERHAPPSQELLRLSYVGPGNGQGGILFLAVVTLGDLDRESGEAQQKLLGQVAVDMETFKQALALLKDSN